MKNFEEQMQILRTALEAQCEVDSPQVLKAQLNDLCALTSNAAWLKAEAKRRLEKAKLQILQKPDSKNSSPSRLKLILDAACANQHGDYIEADRINAYLSHKIDSVRSILSYEKTALERGIE